MKKIQDIKIDINAMCDFEQITGKSLMSALNDMEDIRMTDIRALIQAGLNLEDSKEAGNILMEYMSDENAEPIMNLLSDKLSETGMTKTKKKD